MCNLILPHEYLIDALIEYFDLIIELIQGKYIIILKICK